MNVTLTRIRGAIVMGLAWAVVWAPIAVLAGLIVDPDGSMDEMWPAIGAYPGFLSGVVFSALIGIAYGRRGVGELTLARAGAWGAAAGVLVGVLPFTIGESASKLPLWQLASIVIGSITLLSALSAVASAMVSRFVAGRNAHAGTVHG
ncbi:MAG TPA: hypothetical protein VF710_07705 [Longimicrobium sp.]|jgi:uncharacterized membrane protein